MNSVEALVGEINKAGWLVTEIYQRHESAWFAVLRRSGDFSGAHGEGATIVAALESAWVVAQGHKRMTNTDWQNVKKTPPARFTPTSKPSIPRMKP